MFITVSNTIRIDRPTPELQEWCKRQLVLSNPDYIKKRRMGHWTGNTPEKLTLYERNGESLILPYGTLREILPLCAGHPVRSTFGYKHPVDFCCEIPLYDYQKTAVSRMVSAQYGILQAPAGSGKTQMGIALAARLGLKTLWLTHTVDLLNQSRDRALQYMPADLSGTITAGKVSIGRAITFATVQTMAKLDLDRYRNEWDVVIVDECHRVAGTPTAVTMFGKVLNALAARHKYGLSATVHRADGMIRATYAILGGVAHTVPEHAVNDRVMRVTVTPVHLPTPMSIDYMGTDGTLLYPKLIGYLCNSELRNKRIVSQLIADEDHPSLILSDRLEHLQTLMEMLPSDMRESAVMISGKMTTKKAKAEREAALQWMRDGTKCYLFATYALAKEGLDIPTLERLYLTTPQKDYAVITQSIGRIARTAPGKQNPVAYDFVDDKILYLARAFKKRLTIYRKNGCDFTLEADE